MLFLIYCKIWALHRQISIGASATAYIKKNKFQSFILPFLNSVWFIIFCLIKRVMHAHYNKSNVRYLKQMLVIFFSSFQWYPMWSGWSHFTPLSVLRDMKTLSKYVIPVGRYYMSYLASYFFTEEIIDFN